MILFIVLNIFKSPATKLLITAFSIGAIATIGLYIKKITDDKKKTIMIEETLTSLYDLYKGRKYEQCFEKAESDEMKEKDIPEDKRLEYLTQCRIEAGQAQADLLEYENALEIVKEIPENNNPNYKQVEQKIDEWSYAILKKANDTYDKECNLEESLAITIPIPQSSPIYKLVEIQRQKWKKDYDYNQPLIENANNALELGNYPQALSFVRQVKGASCWVLEARKIGEKVEKEIDKGNANNSSGFPSTSTIPQNRTSPPKPSKIQVDCPPGIKCICPGPLCPDN